MNQNNKMFSPSLVSKVDATVVWVGLLPSSVEPKLLMV